MSIERWDPLRDMMNLRDTVDRMLNLGLSRPPRTSLPALLSRVPLDVIEKGDAFEVRASLPGLGPDDVTISVAGRTVTIRGEATSERQRSDEHWIVHERQLGAFSRTVTLPVPVDVARANAKFERGVLLLIIPKAEEARATQIPVRGEQKGVSANPQQSGGLHSGATPEEKQAHGKDTIVESSMESFPASDPPSWTH